MNIDNYKFYVRDIGISDADLTNVLQDVINDITMSTKIFKKAFGFTIEPDMYDYNFRALLMINEEVQKSDVNNLIIGSYAEDQLLDYLSDPTDLEIDVSKTTTTGIPLNTYLETNDVLVRTYDYDNSPLGSLFYLFEPIDGENFKFIGKIKEQVKVLCITTILPNIQNIDTRLEIFLKPVIIDGLKYYTDTTLNAQNVNSDINSYKKYINAKLELQNKFPVYIGQQIKRSAL